MSSDKLVEIESENWPKLRDLYSADDPFTTYAHCTVDNYIQWLAKEPQSANYIIYSLNGDWSDGTFAVSDRSYVYIASLDANNERLLRLLCLLDYSKTRKFVCVMEKNHSTILEALKLKNVATETNVKYTLFHLPREAALDFEATPPDGITLKPIQECDVHVIETARPDLRNESSEWFARLVRLNANVGAYNDEEQLIGWFYRMVDGQAGGIHVLREYNGLGIGRVLAKHLLRQIAQLGFMNVICILPDNKYSRNIFEPMGFKEIGKTGRVFTVPKTE